MKKKLQSQPGLTMAVNKLKEDLKRKDTEISDLEKDKAGLKKNKEQLESYTKTVLVKVQEKVPRIPAGVPI